MSWLLRRLSSEMIVFMIGQLEGLIKLTVVLQESKRCSMRWMIGSMIE